MLPETRNRRGESLAPVLQRSHRYDNRYDNGTGTEGTERVLGPR